MRLLPVLLALAFAAPAFAQSPDRIVVDAGSIATLPRQEVSGSLHGTPMRCEGVPLIALLRAKGLMPDGPLRGRQLARSLHVQARDGYAVAFSLAELDPDTGNRAVFVADRCNGKPLDEADGPLRLVTPDDVRGARWLRQLESIALTPEP